MQLKECVCVRVCVCYVLYVNLNHNFDFLCKCYGLWSKITLYKYGQT